MDHLLGAFQRQTCLHLCGGCRQATRGEGGHQLQHQQPQQHLRRDALHTPFRQGCGGPEVCFEPAPLLSRLAAVSEAIQEHGQVCDQQNSQKKGRDRLEQRHGARSHPFHEGKCGAEDFTCRHPQLRGLLIVQILRHLQETHRTKPSLLFQQTENRICVQPAEHHRHACQPNLL